MSESYYYNPDEIVEDEETYNHFFSTYEPSFSQYDGLSAPHFQGSALPYQVVSLPPQPQGHYAVDPRHVLPSQHNQHSSPSSTTMQAPHLAVTSPSHYQQAPGQPPYDYVRVQQQQTTPFPRYTESMPSSLTHMSEVGPAIDYLSLPIAGPSQPRPQRSVSITSRASSISYNTDNSRSASPGAAEMAKWGTRNEDGSWSCAYPGCKSLVTFSRGCELRKHHKRHTKNLFCRYPGCPQATSGGFSSKKDRLRHEQSHNPKIRCGWEGCDKICSRVDNMKDHVKRVHLKHANRQG